MKPERYAWYIALKEIYVEKQKKAVQLTTEAF
jgi:hypothetical protein